MIGHLLERWTIEPVIEPATVGRVLPRCHQPCSPQDTDVMRDDTLLQIERIDQMAYAMVLPAKQRDDGQSCWISQGS